MNARERWAESIARIGAACEDDTPEPRHRRGVNGNARGAARGRALSRLAREFPEEYARILADELEQSGLPLRGERGPAMLPFENEEHRV